MYIERAEAIKRIKAALKEKTGKVWSVSGSRGTAWGWITVQAPKRRRVSHKGNPVYDTHWTTPDEPAYFEYVATDQENYYTSDADCQELADAFGLDKPAHMQGVSISPDSREWYVEMAEKDHSQVEEAVEN